MTSDDGAYNHDEIASYIEARYVSAPEAFWRLSEFSMHKQSHIVTRLPVHLPLQHNVYFKSGEEETALTQAHNRCTMLTALFKLNENNPESRSLLYTDIPLKYVFKKDTWVARKRGAARILPRMYAVSARDQERFFLRILLLHVPGPFEL